MLDFQIVCQDHIQSHLYIVFRKQTFVHSVSLKGGQTTLDPRITAPTAVFAHSYLVQFECHVAPS